MNLDLNAYWMPFTANRQFKRDPRMIVAASGAYFEDDKGRRILDGLSGLWCAGLGHGRREIADAVAAQLSRLDYAPAFHFGHPGAFTLASRLAALAPEGLDHVFFTSSGSEAADTALKIARAYWRRRGKGSKTKLIGRAKGYHGVNFGGMSVGGIGPNRTPFGPLLDTAQLGHTQLQENRFSRGIPAHGAQLADQLADIIALHDASNIAAVIVEPFSGSGGVVVPPRGYLERLREICIANEILLIFDEVITGFGRCGARFGAEIFGVIPDIMMVAKQLTNGTVPLGAVLIADTIHKAITDGAGPDYAVELPHGYTYSGHPVACAAALATLDIIESESMIERAAALAPVLEGAVHDLAGLPYVADIRNCGLAAGITIEAYPGEPARRPFELALACWELGVYIRCGGETLQLAPPFIATAEEINRLVETVGRVLRGAGASCAS